MPAPQKVVSQKELKRTATEVAANEQDQDKVCSNRLQVRPWPAVRFLSFIVSWFTMDIPCHSACTCYHSNNYTETSYYASMS